MSIQYDHGRHGPEAAVVNDGLVPDVVRALVEQIVLLVGPVTMFPAFRSQINCSPGRPSLAETSWFNRGSMQVSAIKGSASLWSAGLIFAPLLPATERLFASRMASSNRIGSDHQLSVFSLPIAALRAGTCSSSFSNFTPVRLSSTGGSWAMICVTSPVNLLEIGRAHV